MMAVRVPPFESFYEEHRDAVFRELRRLVGKEAEDAYQETFLRALRAYGKLKHTDNLRAWVNNPQQIKPGVLMPAFGSLPPADLYALVEYLEGLE